MSLLNNIIIKTIPNLPKKMVKIIADQYVAGNTIEDAIKKTKYLNSQKYEVTIDLLGEHIQKSDETNNITNIYLELLNQINSSNLLSNISVKPTHIGLDIGIETFKENALKLVEKAKEYNNFIRFDMENSTTTDATIGVFKEIQRDYKNVGIVFQAYLKRTYSDLEKLISQKINFRLCKGIYNEDVEIAYKDYEEINTNYLKIVELAFKNDTYIGLATHDLNLLKEIYKLIEKYEASNQNFEFQVLYGVPMKGWLQRHLDNNFKVRVYLPYGPQWYEYSIRRLKENPNIAKYVAKSIFSKRDY
jgi:proline dehydrogenase